MDTIAYDKLINLSCLRYVLYMIYPLAKVSPWEQKKMKKETHTSNGKQLFVSVRWGGQSPQVGWQI